MLLGASLCKDILVILTMISHMFIYLLVYLFITSLFVLSLEIGLTKKVSEATSLFLVVVKNQDSKPSSIRWSEDHLDNSVPPSCQEGWESWFFTDLHWHLPA